MHNVIMLSYVLQMNDKLLWIWNSIRYLTSKFLLLTKKFKILFKMIQVTLPGNNKQMVSLWKEGWIELKILTL